MNVAHRPSALVVLSTVVALFAAASSAAANGDPRISETSLGLPTQLSFWGGAAETTEFPDARPLSLAEPFPQGRQTQQTPFIDFSHFEMGGFAGIVAFSSDFEADPTW